MLVQIKEVSSFSVNPVVKYTYLSVSYCTNAYFGAAAFFLPVPTVAMRSDLTEYFFC
jgi:hypothetical protein